MKLQLVLASILLLMIVGEFVETLEIFKFERPYKYYRPRPYRPRSSASRRPSIFLHSKKSSKHPHYYRRRPPSDPWHRPHQVENHVDKEPYTIEIEFPKRYKSIQRITDPHNRNYGLKAEQDYHSNEEDYLEDFQDEVMRLVKKGLRIKAVENSNPKLRIKVSRDDSNENIANPQKFIAPVSAHVEHNPAQFFNHFERQNSQIRMPGYLVTEFPESFRGK